MVVPRGSTGRGKPPQTQKTNAPATITKANTIVYNNQTKGRVELYEEHLREYLKLIRDIPDSYFVNHTVKTGMLGGYVGMRGKKTAAVANGKKAAIAAVPFVRKEKKVVAKVRFFPSNFPKILPSGKSPCDVRKAFIVKIWKADRIAQKKGEEVSRIHSLQPNTFHFSPSNIILDCHLSLD
jgi:hypothetical protein